MEDAKRSLSMLSEALGVQGYYSVSESETATIALPDPIDKETIKALPEEEQIDALNQLININCELARGISMSLDLIHPPKRRKPSSQTLDFRQAAKLLNIKHGSSDSTEQYQDFGLWQAIDTATKQSFQQADRIATHAVESDASEATSSNLGEVLRNITVMHCDKDLEQLRQEASFDETKVDLLRQCLEAGSRAIAPFIAEHTT
eukprot:TRINITY_DN7195_c0_g1_i3.p1 TRINITY_DN7195_c0_g1~~TRINITY_DN7195_c0_g1_i3.p1  ORF type:complete len:204 (+),score=36.95 TRINITY_DN7195_c0_g1_i3:52-663(+)